LMSIIAPRRAAPPWSIDISSDSQIEARLNRLD
jgi:hypothetical protein